MMDSGGHGAHLRTRFKVTDVDVQLAEEIIARPLILVPNCNEKLSGVGNVHTDVRPWLTR